MAVKEPTWAGRVPVASASSGASLMLMCITMCITDVYYRCVHQNAKGIVRASDDEKRRTAAVARARAGTVGNSGCRLVDPHG